MCEPTWKILRAISKIDASFLGKKKDSSSSFNISRFNSKTNFVVHCWRFSLLLTSTTMSSKIEYEGVRRDCEENRTSFARISSTREQRDLAVRKSTEESKSNHQGEKTDERVLDMLTSVNLELIKVDGERTNEISEAFLGAGNFGYVLRTRNTKHGHLRAVKIIDVATVQEKRPWRESVLREMSDTTRLEHSSIVKYFDPTTFPLDWNVKKHNIPPELVAIVMDYCNKSLMSVLQERLVERRNGTPSQPTSVFTKDEISRWTDQLLSGLSYLHDVKKIAHRDPKIDNILLKYEKDENQWNLKMADFGEMSVPRKDILETYSKSMCIGCMRKRRR